jgi:hypothetical protein
MKFDEFGDVVGLGCHYALWVGRGREEEGGCRGDVRNNTITKGKYTSPKEKPRVHNWSHFKAGLRSAAAVC